MFVHLSVYIYYDVATSSRPNERYVNVTGLNDFQGTDLMDILTSLKEKVPGNTWSKIRIGVVGVWTEAKVYI